MIELPKILRDWLTKHRARLLGECTLTQGSLPRVVQKWKVGEGLVIVEMTPGGHWEIYSMSMSCASLEAMLEDAWNRVRGD